MCCATWTQLHGYRLCYLAPSALEWLDAVKHTPLGCSNDFVAVWAAASTMIAVVSSKAMTVISVIAFALADPATTLSAYMRRMLSWLAEAASNMHSEATDVNDCLQFMLILLKDSVRHVF